MWLLEIGFLKDILENELEIILVQVLLLFLFMTMILNKEFEYIINIHYFIYSVTFLIQQFERK